MSRDNNRRFSDQFIFTSVQRKRALQVQDSIALRNLFPVFPLSYKIK